MTDESDLLMLRNVHPHFFDNGRVGSGGFTPSQSHDFCLSVDFDILCPPDVSRHRHETVSLLESAGVFGVTIGEFAENDVDCRADPVTGNDAHALADFDTIRQESKSKLRKVGRKLAAIANDRGKLD